MKKIIYVLLIVAIAVAAYYSFNKSDEQVDHPSPQEIAWDIVEQSDEWKVEDCENDCTHVVADYFLFENPKDAPEIAKMNQNIQTALKDAFSGVVEDSVAFNQATVKSLAEGFIAEFVSYKAEDPEAFDWALEITMDTVLISDKVISFYNSSYSYMGGAHPMSYLAFYNYSKANQDLLKVEDMITDTTALKAVVEAHFKKHIDFEEGRTFSDYGYFEFSEDFVLPENMALTPNGLAIYYNPYEIAPYSLGTTDFTVPYADLKGVLKEEFLIGE